MHPENAGAGPVRMDSMCELDGQLGFPITLLVPAWRSIMHALPKAALANQGCSPAGPAVLILHPFLDCRMVDKVQVGRERHHAVGLAGNRDQIPAGGNT